MVRCNWCGKFMNHGYIYTPFGRYLQDEPPPEYWITVLLIDDEYICDKCFTHEHKALLNNQWRKPSRIDWR